MSVGSSVSVGSVSDTEALGFRETDGVSTSVAVSVAERDPKDTDRVPVRGADTVAVNVATSESVAVATSDVVSVTTRDREIVSVMFSVSEKLTVMRCDRLVIVAVGVPPDAVGVALSLRVRDGPNVRVSEGVFGAVSVGVPAVGVIFDTLRLTVGMPLAVGVPRDFDAVGVRVPPDRDADGVPPLRVDVRPDGVALTVAPDRDGVADADGERDSVGTAVAVADGVCPVRVRLSVARDGDGVAVADRDAVPGVRVGECDGVAPVAVTGRDAVAVPPDAVADTVRVRGGASVAVGVGDGVAPLRDTLRVSASDAVGVPRAVAVALAVAGKVRDCVSGSDGDGVVVRVAGIVRVRVSGTVGVTGAAATAPPRSDAARASSTATSQSSAGRAAAMPRTAGNREGTIRVAPSLQGQATTRRSRETRLRAGAPTRSNEAAVFGCATETVDGRRR